MSGNFGHHRAQQGFTLTEVTIVLGAIGLVLASIWVTYGSVTQRIKMNATTLQIATLTQNLARLFPPNSGSNPPLNTDLAPLLISSDAVPSTMIKGSQLIDGFDNLFYLEYNAGFGAFTYQFTSNNIASECLSILQSVKAAHDTISRKYISTATVTDDYDTCIALGFTPPCSTGSTDTIITKDTPITNLREHCESTFTPNQSGTLVVLMTLL